MANCKYCGAPAGFLRRSHRTCRERYRIAEKQIPTFFPKALTSSVAVHNFAELTRQVAATHFVGDAELRRLALIGAERMVAQAMADGTISEADENRISEIRNAFGVEFHDLAHSTQMRIGKAKMLRELAQGITPKVAKVVGSIPISLQKNEIVLWIFNAVSYYVVRTETRYVGGSRGVSVRLMKGVSVRAGAHRGQKVQSRHLRKQGVGDFYITNKGVYFKSPSESIRIDTKKIVSATAMKDAIEVIKDSANPKPQFFQVDDPAFAAAVISMLGRLR